MSEMEQVGTKSPIQLPDQVTASESDTLDKILVGESEDSEKEGEGEKAEEPAPEQRPRRRDADPAWLEAKAVLTREGWPPKAIRALGRDEAIDIAEARRTVQAERDRSYGRQSQLQNNQRPREDRGERNADTRGKAAPDFAVLDELEPLLRQELGEAGPKVAQALKVLRDAVSNRPEPEPDTRIDTLGSMVGDLLASHARKELAASFPEIAEDDDAFDDLRDQAIAMLGTGRFKTLQAALEYVARATFYEAHTRTSKDRDDRLARKRADGSSTKPTSTRPAQQSLSDRDDVALNAIWGGKGKDAARAAYQK